MAEDWARAIWCPYTDDHRCVANIPEACQCRKMPPLIYRDAVARARGERMHDQQLRSQQK